jgi:hypothetical protein
LLVPRTAVPQYVRVGNPDSPMQMNPLVGHPTRGCSSQIRQYIKSGTRNPNGRRKSVADELAVDGWRSCRATTQSQSSSFDVGLMQSCNLTLFLNIIANHCSHRRKPRRTARKLAQRMSLFSASILPRTKINMRKARLCSKGNSGHPSQFIAREHRAKATPDTHPSSLHENIARPITCRCGVVGVAL